MGLPSPIEAADRSDISAIEPSSVVVQSTLALSVVVVGIKIGKLFADFRSDNPTTWPDIVCSSWLIRLSVGVAIAFVVGRTFWPLWKWRICCLPFLFVLSVKVVLAEVRGTPSVAYLWLLEAVKEFWSIVSIALYVLRSDIAFLACFALVTYVAILVVKPYGLGKILLRTILTILFLVSGIELASYCKLGVAGSGHLLAFFLTNAAMLWPMLKPEIDTVSVAALLTPVAAGFFVMWLVSRSYSRFAMKPFRLPTVIAVAVTILLGAQFLPAIPVDHRFDHFVSNTYLSLGDMLPWRKSGGLEVARQASRMPPLFDTTNATLQTSDHTPPTPRNVVIIMLESARANATTVGDPNVLSTPFLAEFAKRGAVVPEMYAVIPRTSAAWVAVLDGIWPSVDEEMARWTQTGERQTKSLPTLLATRGYSSAYFTSGHLNFGYDASLIKNEGFDQVFDGDSLPHQGFEQPMFWGFEDKIMLDPSLDWVKQQRDRKKPFFLMMMTTIGHYDYEYPRTWQPQLLSTKDASYNNYLNCLKYVDSVVKDLIDGLDKLGVLRSSMVIILGDHGESFGEHGPRIHSLALYDEMLKIPTIIYAEGLTQAGTVFSGLRQEIDIMPTVLDGLGLVAKTASFPGTSMFKPVPADRTLYFSGAIYSQSIAMRRGGLKYVYNFGRSPTEVYAIDQDPGEMHNMAASLGHSSVDKAELDMLVWRERVSRAFSEPSNQTKLSGQEISRN